MGVVAVPNSASRTFSVGSISRKSRPVGRAIIVALKTTDRATKCSTLVSKGKRSTAVPLEQPTKDSPKKTESHKKMQQLPEQELDYNEVAAVLENIYKLSPNDDVSHVLRSRKRRLSLEKRVAMKRKRSSSSKADMEEGEEEAERLVRDYSASTDLVGVDWRKMKIPQVLCSSEQACLFKLMQPMKAIFEVKEKLQKDFTREPTDGEVAVAVNMSVPQMRRHIEVGQAARNKLIKSDSLFDMFPTRRDTWIKYIKLLVQEHNLRLVLFVINKYFQQIASGEMFQDLCQAGAKGLITAIDRFEPKRGFRLSTYALFWIRHSIVRSMTVSSFTRVSFGIESVRQEIQKAKLELMCELQRLPTEEEIIARVGISPQRYHDVMKASKSISSLNARHVVTQEEFIDGVTDSNSGGDQLRQPALLRLALDDVLDSLKPKESLVIRQRYGLDGKGNRTLGEIAGNLNISREMVRKHELKALMKLKHPGRLDYLRRCI